jgi:uncharacterized surface protein with fasciclin (FAS1) repeats
MNIRSYPFSLLLACVLAVSLTACDQSSQKIDFGDGSNLTVDGPGRLVLEGYQSGPGIKADTVTGEYMVSAYTVEQEYSWSLTNSSGLDMLGQSGPDFTRRDQGNEGNPEVVGERSMNPRSYQVQVTTTIDGEEYTGGAATKVDYPNASSQLTPGRKLSLASTLLGAAGLVGVLDSDADDAPPNRWTAFLPETDALTAALDTSGNGAIEAPEIPATGVLQRILLYHVAPDSLGAAEAQGGGTTPTLLHPQETLSLSGTGVTATNSSGTFQRVDIPTSDGLIHSINGVLLPNSVVSIKGQTVIRGDADTVNVEGTYVHDGGFVALHDADDGSIIGTSDYLETGFHGNTDPIQIELNSPLPDSSGVVAMPHRDTNGNEAFDFSGGSTDAPYFRGTSSTAVTDTAGVAVP